MKKGEQITKRQFQRTTALDPQSKGLFQILTGCVSYFLHGDAVSFVLVIGFALFIAVGNGAKWAVKMVLFYTAVAYLNVLLRYVSVPVLSVIMSVFGVTVLKLIPVITPKRNSRKTWRGQGAKPQGLTVGGERLPVSCETALCPRKPLRMIHAFPIVSF